LSFRGQHEHSLDAKDRLTIPAKLRSKLADGVVLLASLDPCVEVWPADAYDLFTEKALGKLNPLSADARQMSRRFNSDAEDESLDSAGRVRIAKQLIEHGSLSGQCMVVGAGDHLEVWNPERWAEHSTNYRAQANTMAEEIAAAEWNRG
jgi:MraZ protein